MQNVTNMINFLLANRRNPSLPETREIRILRAIGDGTIPLSDLTLLTRLSPEQLAEDVEMLRARRHVEIVKYPDSERLYIQRTYAGYRAMSPD